MVIAFWMPCLMVATGIAMVPGLVSLPRFDTYVPRPLQVSSGPFWQSLSLASPQISGAPGWTVLSLSSQSPSQSVTPSWSLSLQTTLEEDDVVVAPPPPSSPPPVPV